MVFVARIIRHKLCMIFEFFTFFVQKSFLTKNQFLTVEINLTTRGLLYTCLVECKINLTPVFKLTNSSKMSKLLLGSISCALYIFKGMYYESSKFYLVQKIRITYFTSPYLEKDSLSEKSLKGGMKKIWYIYVFFIFRDDVSTNIKEVRQIFELL